MPLNFHLFFAFKKEEKTLNRLSNNGKAYWEKKRKGGLGCSKTSIKIDIIYIYIYIYIQSKNFKTQVIVNTKVNDDKYWKVGGVLTPYLRFILA